MAAEDPLGPDPLVWLGRLDEKGPSAERLLRLSPAEFSAAVDALGKEHDARDVTRLVWLVAMNFKWMQQNLPPELADRAAAALVKVVESGDADLRLQNLGNITGADHPLIREMLERLSGSEHGYTALLAKRNLGILKELERGNPSYIGKPAPVPRQTPPASPDSGRKAAMAPAAPGLLPFPAAASPRTEAAPEEPWNPGVIPVLGTGLALLGVGFIAGHCTRSGRKRSAV